MSHYIVIVSLAVASAFAFVAAAPADAASVQWELFPLATTTAPAR